MNPGELVARTRTPGVSQTDVVVQGIRQMIVDGAAICEIKESL